MTRLTFLAAVCACDAGERAAPAPPPPIVAPRCVPESTDTRYVVCVVDDAGRPVRGAKVSGRQTMVGSTIGHGGVFLYELGTLETDELGRVEFPIQIRRSGFIWSGKELSREVEIANDGATVTVGSPAENSSAIGVGGDQTDESQPYAGAIYAFEGAYGSD